MYRQLTPEQRYTISVMLRQEMPKKTIASTINVHVSTVYREIRRNSSRYTGVYGHAVAQRNASRRKLRYQSPRRLTPSVRASVIRHLMKRWSPKQIAGRFRLLGRQMVSHETIYEMIRRDKARGGRLYRYCRFSMKHTRHRLRGKGVTRVDGRKGIELRPEDADGKRFGDWEMDLIVGPGRSAVLTVIERMTCWTAIRKLPRGYTAGDVARAVIRALWPYREHVRTITTDNGNEFAYYETIEKSLNCMVYYARPYAPWQKGAVENANMLIRQYLPKRTDLYEVSTQLIAKIQDDINRRPRLKLNFRTPFFVFNKIIS